MYRNNKSIYNCRRPSNQNIYLEKKIRSEKKMKSITKNKIFLIYILIALILAIGNINYTQHSNNTNSLEVKTENKTVVHRELKISGDNDYIKVWDTGTTFASSIYSVCTGDQDSDGKKEIIVCHANEFAVFEYNSTYANYTLVWKSEDISSSMNTICTGDQDGDGKREIIGGGNDATLYIYEYNGTDYEQVLDEYMYAPNWIYGICIGNDVDKDGNKEIIFTGSINVYVYEYNGTDNGCKRTWEFDFGYPNYAYSACGSNDLDGDGKKEIISDGSDRIHVFESTANNTYTDVWNSSSTIGADTMSICIGEDLDGDGKKEIIAGSEDGKLYIFEFNGTDNGYNKTWDSGTNIGGSIRSVCIGDDLDGDGKKEIIAGSEDGKLYIFEFNGTDNGFNKVWDSDTNIGDIVTSVCIGDDADSNGKKEIIAGSEDDKVYVFEFNGIDNGFDKVWDSNTIIGGNVRSVCFGDDLDGNGKKEIIAGSEDGKVYIFEYDDTVPPQVIYIEDDDDDDDDEDENGIFIPNTTLIIGGIISAIAIVVVIILLIKRKR